MERAVQNLAFRLEQDHESLRARLGSAQETLEELAAQLESVEAEDVGTATANSVEPGDDGAAVDELKALRREVGGLYRELSEERRVALRRRTRRLGVPVPRLAPQPPRQAGRAPGSAPPLKARLRRFRKRSARLPRRARLRLLRLLRRTKARLRDRFFARRLGSLNHHAPKELKLTPRYYREIKLDDPYLISIVTPSFNQGAFLVRTIRSVVEQDYPRLEYIVQDGGSTDETGQVLANNAERLHHYEMRDDDGHAHAINLGFEHASGEIMAFLNSDDLLLPGSLHYVARYFERHPQVDVVYGHRVLIDQDDMEIGRWILPRHDPEVLSWADYIPQETMFWRRGIWEAAGGQMDQQWPFALDWDLLVRLRDAGASMVRLPRFLGAFRIHEAQKTSAIMETQGEKEAAELRKRIHGREVSKPEIKKAVKPYLRRHHVLQKMYRVRLLRY